MTPKERSRELVDLYCNEIGTYTTSLVWDMAKRCALIAVEQIIEAIDWHEFEQPNKEYNYWNEVKQEIEKL
jgi:hypothetical protein